MEYNVEKVSPVKRKVSVTAPAAGVNAMIGTTIKNIGRDVALDGFRKGKAPAKVIEKRFHGEVYDKATEALINMQIRNVLDIEGLTPFSRIQIDGGSDGGKLERDQDYVFSFSFEVLPPLDLPADMEQLSVEIESPELGPEEVEDITLRIRRTMATLETVAEDRLPQDGDIVRVDMLGTVEGRVVPGMKADNYLMQLHPSKPGEADDSVDAKTRTLRAGQEGAGTMLCPADHPDPTMRGKTVEFKIKLHEINREVLPDLDDDFAKKVGFGDLATLRKAIFEQAMNNKVQGIKAKGQKKLLDSLLDAQNYDLPDSAVNTFLTEYRAEAHKSLRRQGLDEQTIASTLENMKEEGQVQARIQAKAHVYLLSLALRENLKVSEQDLDRQIRQIAYDSQQDFNQVLDILLKTNMIHDLQDRMLASKALDFLYGKAKKIVVGPDGKPLPVGVGGKDAGSGAVDPESALATGEA